MSSENKTSVRENFRGNSMIDPTMIYGFPNVDGGAEPIITDHPLFPNPRTEPMDEGLISDITEAGEFLEPVMLYEFQEDDGTTSIILVNGKTRMTTVARVWATTPETNAFATVPYTIVEGTPNDIRMLMAKLNLEETRRPLSALETVRHLIYMKEVHGMSEDEMARLLNKENRGGVRWIREMMRLVGLDDVVEAVTTGDIDLTTAKEVAKIDDPKEREAVVAQVVEQKAEGKTEKEARQNVTTAARTTGKDAGKPAPLTPISKTTLGFKETFTALSDFYPEAKEALTNELDVDAIDFNDELQRITYITNQETIARFREYMRFLKLDSMRLGQQFDTIESWIKPDDLESMKLVRHPDQSQTNTKKAEAPKAEKPVKAPEAPKADKKADKPAPKKVVNNKPATPPKADKKTDTKKKTVAGGTR